MVNYNQISPDKHNEANWPANANLSFSPNCFGIFPDFNFSEHTDKDCKNMQNKGSREFELSKDLFPNTANLNNQYDRLMKMYKVLDDQFNLPNQNNTNILALKECYKKNLREKLNLFVTSQKESSDEPIDLELELSKLVGECMAQVLK